MLEVMARRHDPMCERSSLRHTSGGGSAAAAAASAASLSMSSKAQVVYYLCRGGKMEPPHMIEVPHSHCDGLRLRDVKHRLTILRGGGMPNLFSWSCKRLYKNTHIWQDVCDEDSLTPASGGEYVLKGSEYFDNSQGGDKEQALQRKFRGAESWLRNSPKSSLSSRGEQQQAYSESYSNMASHMRTLTMDAVRRPAASNDSAEEHKISNGGASSEDSSGMHDIGVCEVSRSGATSVPFQDQPCNLRTAQAEDTTRYSEYKSGSSTPNCIGPDRKLMYHHQQHQQHQQLEGTRPQQQQQQQQNGKSKKRLSSGRKSAQNVKMKQSAASCAFLHILSYCGGVETKAQSSAAPTEITSSEYSFDGGICSAENKLVTAALRSPQYSVSSSMVDMVHKEQALLPPYANRSGPLIPYSSEYFDVKETVTPPPASPLQQQQRCSKAISRCSSK